MKVEVQKYKKTIHDIGLPYMQEAAIWDFYVSKAIVSSASQGRKVSDYGLKNLPWKEMLEKAEIAKENSKILLANSINKTLGKYDLIIEKKKDKKDKKAVPIEIEIDKPRIVCLTPYTISDEEKPDGRVGEAESVLTHIRNAFAHGNTYFFDNGFMMLEDKNKQTITARMIIKQQTLLDWIGLVDKEERYYILRACGKERKD